MACARRRCPTSSLREAIRGAARAAAVTLKDVHKNGLLAQAARDLGLSDTQLAKQLDGIGRAAGRPWAKDQKDACLAALIALGGSRKVT
jgi:hypothetical protein